MIFTEISVVKTKENNFYIDWEVGPTPTTTPPVTTTPGPLG
jgi:hypothetical protein